MSPNAGIAQHITYKEFTLKISHGLKIRRFRVVGSGEDTRLCQVYDDNNNDGHGAHLDQKSSFERWTNLGYKIKNKHIPV